MAGAPFAGPSCSRGANTQPSLHRLAPQPLGDRDSRTGNPRSLPAEATLQSAPGGSSELVELGGRSSTQTPRAAAWCVWSTVPATELETGCSKVVHHVCDGPDLTASLLTVPCASPQPATQGPLLPKASSAPLFLGHVFQTPGGCLKPQMGPNPIYTICFSYTYVPIIKLNL